MLVRKSIVSCLVALGILPVAIAQNQSEVGEGLWMTIKSESAIPAINEAGKLVSRDHYLNMLIQDFSIFEVKKALPDSRNSDLQSVIEMRCNCDSEKLKEALSKSDAIKGIHPAPEYELLNQTPTDDYLIAFSEDYALDLIDAAHAWNFSTGDPNLVIGISDGGYYANQEELEGKYNYLVNSNNAPANYYYHGTAVATTAAGSTNNGLGKSSIGYDCRLALTTIGYNQLLQLAYNGARVLNVSWTSGCYPNPYIQNVINELYAHGVIVVAAAGNGSTCGSPSALVFPAACDNVISVTSVGQHDNHEKVPGNLTSTHQHNSTVDLSAPGYNVPLCIAPGFYTTGNGTSFAAPFVSGTIGLILSLNPCLNFEEVLNILQASATNIDELNPSYVGLLGAGRLNAGLALEYAMNAPCEYNYIGENSSVEASAFGLSKIQVNAKTDLRVFPNPTTGTVNVEFENIENGEIRVVDAMNRIVDVKVINEFDTNYSLMLDQDGIYFVQIFQNGTLIRAEKIAKV